MPQKPNFLQSEMACPLSLHMLPLKHTGTTCKSKSTLFKQVYLLNFSIKINRLLKFKQKSPLLKQWQSIPETSEISQPLTPFRTTYKVEENRTVEENKTLGCSYVRLCTESKHTGLSRFSSALEDTGKTNSHNKL